MPVSYSIGIQDCLRGNWIDTGCNLPNRIIGWNEIKITKSECGGMIICRWQ